MRFFTPLLCLFMAVISNLFAEGTREMAPNANINIGASVTTDLAALHINHPSYNNFASYTNNDPHSRLYIHIVDPTTECVFLGFSFGHFNETSANPTRVSFQYRIKDPAGNVVFGPVTIPTNSANIQNWSQAFTGPMQINGGGGYNAHEVTSADLMSEGWSGAGDYYVEFLSADDVTGDFLIDFWDITVADCSPVTPVAKLGRIWSYNWSIFAVNDFGFPNRPFNGAFYVCAPDPADPTTAFVTKIDFNGAGFRPAAFNVAFNSFGSMNSGNIEQDRKSRQGVNSTQSEYAIFLNDPIELCKTALVGEVALHGISRCDAGDYCIKFTASIAGQIDILLDFDGADDIFTPGSADVLILYNVSPEEAGSPLCIPWNGLNGLGQPMPEVPGTQIPITISYAQGIYHFPIYDAEFMTVGFRVEAVRPVASIPLLYYDDSDIDVLSGSGEPVVQLEGCNVPCHRWTVFLDAGGFGNLNTINSWWFSQRVIHQDVLLLPAYYTCEILGPQSICQGSTTDIVFNPVIHPSSSAPLEFIVMDWTGPGIVGSNTGETITIAAEGDYQLNVTWLTALGDTCHTSCDYSLAINPPLTETIDTLILQGEVLNINGELYTEAGQYIQTLTNTFGCDSILTINVIVLQTVIHYNLDACWSFMSDGSHMDYSEFTATQPEPLSCADITASIVFREPASMQKHSCTPGVNGSIAMCISSLDTCDYDAGNDASLVFEISISPDPDTSVRVTGLSFFEKAPIEFVWISGDSGVNNYPTLYGLRVLKNGVEIYRREDIPTSLVWSLQDYDFLNDDAFLIEDPATFRFELLPYCLIGNGSPVNAWDIDEIRVTASCAPFEGLNQVISGIVRTPDGQPVKNVTMQLAEKLIITQNRSTATDEDGKYVFENVIERSECHIRTLNNQIDYLNGVSTLDLVHIQRHLLGMKPFDSPYKFVAADANHSNTVSAKDLLELRKLILGIIPKLPTNTSWRFGTADENAHGGYTWGFKETVDIELLRNDFHNADFTAVKIGDVNGDVEVKATGSEIVKRQSDVFSLSVTDQDILKNQPVEVPVTATTAAQLMGMQFALSLQDVESVTFQSGAMEVGVENYLITADGITFSWNHSTGIGINPGQILFTMIITPVHDRFVSSLFTLNNDQLNAEVYTGDELVRMPIDLSIAQPMEIHNSNQLFQNSPNPFSANTNIRFQLEKSGFATIRIFDLSGHVVKEVSGYYERGFQSVEIFNLTASAQGILICQLQGEAFMETVRMVIMN